MTRAQYKCMQCGIKKKGMKMYYDNVLNEEHAALHVPTSAKYILDAESLQECLRGCGV